MRGNPTVSLQLDQVTSAEAAAALTAASGIPLDLLSVEDLQEARATEALARLGERHSFHWERLPFAAALRELCRAYSLDPIVQVQGRYTLLPDTDGPALDQPAPFPAFCAEGLSLYVRSVRITHSRSLRLKPCGSHSVPYCSGMDHGSLSVGLVSVHPYGDPNRLVGIRNWRAVDNLDHELTDPVRFKSEFGKGLARGTIGPYPDTWEISMSLSQPAPGATTLPEMTGELMQFESSHYTCLEFPVPVIPGTEIRHCFREVEIEVTGFMEAEPPREYGTGVRSMPGLKHHTLTLRINKPKEITIWSPGAPNYIRPELLGESGRPLAMALSEGEYFALMEVETIEIEARHVPDPNDPPARVVLELVVQSRPAPLVQFRFEEVPLPR